MTQACQVLMYAAAWRLLTQKGQSVSECLIRMYQLLSDHLPSSLSTVLQSAQADLGYLTPLRWRPIRDASHADIATGGANFSPVH